MPQFRNSKQDMDSEMVKNGLSNQSLAMFAVSSLLFISSMCLFVCFNVPCLYYARRFISQLCCCYNAMITPHHSEVEHHPTPARFNDTEDEPISEVTTQSTALTSSPSVKWKVIIEHQEE
jgi:hypothetical protein